MCYSALALFKCFLSGPLVKNFVPKNVGRSFWTNLSNYVLICALFDSIFLCVISMRFLG
jgi:hypothetical protein